MQSLDILKPKNTRSILQVDEGGLGDHWIQKRGVERGFDLAHGSAWLVHKP